MLQSVDLLAVESTSSDQQLLRAYLQQLANQPFLQFRFSYGDELSLHFGSPRSYSSARLKHLNKGSYIIAARASNWFLRTAEPPRAIMGTSDPASSDQESLTKEDLETSSFVRQGARILAAEPILYTSGSDAAAGFALSLLLSDGTSFFLCPNLDSPIQEEEPLCDWEVFTLYERCLEVGPGLQWAYVDTREESLP